MKFVDVWIVCTPAVWDAIAPEEGAAKEIWHYPYSQAKVGYYNDLGAKRAYAVLAKPPQLVALMAALAADTPGDAAIHGRWEQGTGLDDLDNPHDPAEVLAMMKDIQLYDQDGNPTGSTPATYDDPNWAHAFAGQKTRVFAGDFSDDFSEDFF